MPEKFLTAAVDDMPEAFVAGPAAGRGVSRAVREGRLRKLASRLYTANRSDPPEEIVGRNLWNIVAGYFPGALVADRTALDNSPADDGSVCLIADAQRSVRLPGYTLRPRRGVPRLPSDRPFVAGLFLSSTARAYLENMRFARAGGGAACRAVPGHVLEYRLDHLIRRLDESAVARLRDEIRTMGIALDLEEEAAGLDALIGSVLEIHTPAPPRPSRAPARPAIVRTGGPFDVRRTELFRRLYAALRAHPPMARIAPGRSHEGNATLAFYDAYFSNFIEGTEFEVDEAADIVFRGHIPDARPEDAHDVLGTWRLVSDPRQMRSTPASSEDLKRLLGARHATIMESRPEMHPGRFKTENNHAGPTVFVAPELVAGTLEQGFMLCRRLETPFQRAVFMMFLVSEVHPFADGNGRTARVMMNAELAAAGEERIVIPTVYRNRYLNSLRELSQTGDPGSLIWALDYAQHWTAGVDWRSVDKTRQELEDCNAFLDADMAEIDGLLLRMPARAVG